ncbi:hypothetical protein [Desulfotignum balticum]|uniref:hypothetical protein n=1 Tax=Desulfotignum balticum TaxID=115781 RepID=UPI0012EBDD29|nr:hypothetical protein [Desulfotignum balticum]
MKNKSSNVFDILSNYFSIVDSAPIGGDSIFADENSKQRHESILMYAFRKYQASCYHVENVKRFLDDDYSSSISSDFSSPELLPDNGVIKTSVTKTADHFIYELAAFFEAVKSALDFIATACSEYLKGTTTDSIRSFIRSVDKNSKRGYVYNVTRRHIVWLKKVREYRHHLVHRMVITTSTGQENHKRGKIVKQVRHPVVVPEKTPSYFPDTRYSRMMQEERDRLDCTFSESTVEYPNGTKEVVDFSIEYSPSKGYVEISELMKLHLHQFEEFFCDMISEIKKMKFLKYD